ncbi:anti-sigma factor antagonist [candidate division KSB1 bacterium]|nr:anti-sigma factor antagonist [candidate division KSB1 bacterium]
MELQHRIANDIVIVSLSGKMMGGPDAAQLVDLLHDFLERGRKKFIVDLSGVDVMNSSGLGILINALTTVKNQQGQLKLASVTDKIKHLFTITKLGQVFEIHETVDSATNSFV